MINCHRTHRSRPRHNHQQCGFHLWFLRHFNSLLRYQLEPSEWRPLEPTWFQFSRFCNMITMVKRGRHIWKMIESPAPDTDLEIDSLDVLGEIPSAWRKCGEKNGDTRPKIDVWTTYVLYFDLSSHINLLHSRFNPIQATRKFFDAINNVIIIKRPRETHFSKYVYKLWVLAQ